MAWPQLGALSRENVAAAKGFEGFKGFIAVESVSIPFQSRRHSLLDSMAPLAMSFFLSPKSRKGDTKDTRGGSIWIGSRQSLLWPRSREDERGRLCPGEAQGEKKASILVLMMSQNVAAKCSESFRDLLEVLCSAT